MDKARMLAKRPSKSSKTQPSGDLFALGSKKDDASKGAGSLQRKIVSSSNAAATGALPVRRESPAMGGMQPKKPKLMSQSFTPLGRTGELERRGSPALTQVYLFEEIAKDVDPIEFLDAVEEAENSSDEDDIEKVICGAVKYLRSNRAKPEQAMYLGLMYLAKTRPNVFESEVVIEAMCSLLKRDVSSSFKAKGNPLIPVLACNVLLAAFHEDDNWPDSFIKVYLEDALGERVWVDRDDCKSFVDNIQTAFGTKLPNLTDTLKSEQSSSAASSPLHTSVATDDSSMDVDFPKFSSAAFTTEASNLIPRYKYQQVSVETSVLDTIREHLNKRQAADGVLRNTIKLMISTSGYAEIRNMAAQRLEMWIQNPKLTKNAQDLLQAVCMNCDQHSKTDIEAISHLSKIRLKNKHILLHYMQCMRELIDQHTENLQTLMTHTLYNELSQSRNPNNMALLGQMFVHSPERSAKTLAFIFQDFLSNKDDYLRALRALFREIVRSVRQEMKFTDFALGLMEERKESKFTDLEAQYKERLMFALSDLICLTAYMSVSPAVREAAAAIARGDSREIETLQQFQQNVAVIQRDAVWWLHTIVPKMFNTESKMYVTTLRKVLFLDSADSYHKIDNWPPEGDRMLLLRLVCEVPVLEDTLMRVQVIGLTRELRVNPTDSIDIAEQLVRRAAPLYSPDFPVLKVERLEMIDALFHLSTYKHPENATFPAGYQPPTMAISTLYWKAWSILLVICAFNPETFGQTAWDNYPMLRCLMEMVMTGNYSFPPPTMATEDTSLDEIRAKERQTAELEKHSILEFEGYLAAGSRKEPINESNSLLLKSLTSLEPSASARKPPQEVMDTLEKINQKMKLNQMLCRSRKPDFLMDIIKRQGTSQSMPWLADLVESSDSSLDILPIQCLCEFLLIDSSLDAGDDAEGRTKNRPKKQEQLVSRLQNLLHSPASEIASVVEMLDYFLQRLSSQQLQQRQQAVKGLSLVLSKSHMEVSHFDMLDDEDDEEKMDVDQDPALHLLSEHKWLLQLIPALSQFSHIKANVCAALRKACEVETDASSVSAYVMFLSRHSADLQMHDMDSSLFENNETLQDLAQLIVERASLMNHVLPQNNVQNPRGELVLAAMVDLFYNYLKKAQQPTDEGYSWSNTQDQIVLQWKNGEAATMNILVVHAMVILLTYTCPSVESHFKELLDCWFPENDDPPSAFLVDTSEEALLLPDWLKLRMIRSCNQRLVDAALQDLETQQLMLFVQSFGIPVQSMSKLLECLDKAVDLEGLTTDQVVVDKNYMAQLVEVQHMRGVRGGDKFINMLTEGLDQDIEDDSVTEKHAPRVRRTESQLLITPTLPDFIHKDVMQIIDLLTKMFSDSVQVSERNHMFRSIQKTLAQDTIQATVVSALKTLVKGKQSKQFILELKKNIHMSCPLIRLLAQKSGKDKKFLSLLHCMQKALGDSKSSLSVLVNNLVLQHSSKGTHMGKVMNYITQREENGDSLISIVKDAHESPDSSLKNESENIINTCVMKSLASVDQKSQMTQTLCQLLMLQPQGTSTPASTVGLLVNWLGVLDPETVSTCADLQNQLLYSHKKLINSPVNSGNKGDVLDAIVNSCEPFLMALLVHQSNWHTLKSCINVLLSDEEAVERYDARKALDFLWACLHLPKLWQGQDKKHARNHKQEDIMGLTELQIKLIAAYILKEAEDSSKKTTPKKELSSLNVQITSESCDVIADRIPLLKKCVHSEESLLKALVYHLSTEIDEHKPREALCKQLLLEIYLQIPSVCMHLGEILEIPEDIPCSYKGSSQLDELSHRVISSLSSAGAGKKTQCKMYDANIVCRKFAAQHPMLLLRQLPMIAGALQGQSTGSFNDVKNKNYFFLFTHMLGILELLQPYIFHVQYEKPMSEVLEAFFQLIRLHGLDSRHLVSLITKFVKFIYNYQCADASLAARVLHVYKDDMIEMSGVYPELTTLRSVLSALVVPSKTDGDSDEVSHFPPPSRPPSPLSTSQLAPFLQKIAKGNSSEDVLSVLQDLDETSKRKVDIIEHFVTDLKRLMLDESETIRSTAFNLMMRHVRQYPRDTESFVASYLKCLSHHNVDVVKTALNNMAEFVVLARDNAVVLLQKAFEVAITSKLDTSNFLTEALQLLNMETML